MSSNVVLSYPTSIYRFEVVQRAVADYGGICSIMVSGADGRITCSFAECPAGASRVAREFSNYLLELTIAWSRI